MATIATPDSGSKPNSRLKSFKLLNMNKCIVFRKAMGRAMSAEITQLTVLLDRR
jgi:hypothetical protein